MKLFEYSSRVRGTNFRQCLLKISQPCLYDCLSHCHAKSNPRGIKTLRNHCFSTFLGRTYQSQQGKPPTEVFHVFKGSLKLKHNQYIVICCGHLGHLGVHKICCCLQRSFRRSSHKGKIEYCIAQDWLFLSIIFYQAELAIVANLPLTTEYMINDYLYPGIVANSIFFSANVDHKIHIIE